MKRGISFEIPNKYGSLLGDVLKPIDVTAFSWRIGNGESYIIVNNELDKELFPGDKEVIEGVELRNLLEDNKYYVIFADLQAYPKNEFSDIGPMMNFLKVNVNLFY